MLHFPEDPAEPKLARERLALDEFMELQFRIQKRRKLFQLKARAMPCGGDNRLIRPLLKGLGFKLTAAQTGVLREIRKDMSGNHPMRRLLQGDVGSGKTVVAAYARMVEELRISLFAQEVKTAFPVSAKRLDQAWEEVRGMVRLAGPTPHRPR